MVTQDLINLIRSANQDMSDAHRLATPGYNITSRRSSMVHSAATDITSRSSTRKTASAISGRVTSSSSVRSLSISEISDINDPHHDSNVRHNGNQIGHRHLWKSLQKWKPEYRIRSLSPLPDLPAVATFSARLGKKTKFKRIPSPDSDTTVLSLLSHSSYGNLEGSRKSRGRRRKRRPAFGEDERTEDGRSIWVQLASRPQNFVHRLHKMNVHNHLHSHLLEDTETEIFKKLPAEEKMMVTLTTSFKWVHLGPGDQRSDSASRINKHYYTIWKKPQRTQSANGKHEGPMIDFKELWKQRVKNQLKQLASMQEKQTFLRNRFTGRRSHGGKNSFSRLSIATNISHSPKNLSPLVLVKEEDKEDQVFVWRGDQQILAIDLQRELTAKVQNKIDSTTTELLGVTGLGDDNEARNYCGPLEEFPSMVDEDYSRIAKIPQQIRICPDLSGMIRTDIKVRMGRPRYHEIRESDLVAWNQNQFLDRAHRNLKVFNWLHSLREMDFDMSKPPEEIEDRLPDEDELTHDQHVVSVDDPKIKPLFERLKSAFIVFY